jgi:hypothetical protein
MSEAYIFVQLMGGLGNQLFQYAAGMLQAKITNGTLLLCKATQNHHSKKDYRDIMMNKGNKYDDMLPSHISFYQEDAFKPWNPYDYKYPTLYMYGYFQNYPSLKPILDEFRENILSHLNYQKSIVSKQYAIKEGDVFIHVRRGDYISTININTHHVQGLEYYAKAIYILKESVNIKRWFIFSDDMKWCKEQDLFEQLQPIFIEEPDEVYTLAIMSEITSGAIIANSSFSWMGALLGVGTNKKNSVIYPKKWYKNTTPDLFPTTWIGI